MAKRPVFTTANEPPFYKVVDCEFEWFAGFSKAQKQRSINALHGSFTSKYPGLKVLEISSKSMQKHGEELSAFFLKKYVPELGRSIPVECVFQSGKVFKNAGPYKDLMSVTPREAKRDERLKQSGPLVGFAFDGKEFPLEPKTIFYDYIYINALFENKELAEEIMKYNAFTDIEFNPKKSLNCQAKAAATYVSLTHIGFIDVVKEFENFVKLYEDIIGSRTEKKSNILE